LYGDTVEDWDLESVTEADWEDFDEPAAKIKVVPDLTPSRFTEFAFRMPAPDGMGYENFSFEGRRHMRRCYDTPAKRVLLCCARQVEKSTLLGNTLLCYSCLVPAHKSLYISPSATQTKTFSADRLKEPIETSPILSAYTTKMLSQNVFEKQFANRSKITLRYAFLNADRARGIPAWRLAIDELQDILFDNIPVIEQCTAHAPERWKSFYYSGTPKSLDNTIEYYRSRWSTQGEWVVPCDRHGGDGGRYWNVLGERNIGKDGLICEKCGGGINPMNDGAQWANMVEYDPLRTPFESYRISQLMVPWRSWNEIMLDYQRYPRDRFYNEVLGISCDSGTRPLTAGQLIAVCDDKASMSDHALQAHKAKAFGQPVFMGVDWGSGSTAYTVVFLGTYDEQKFRIFYAKRFTGDEIDPEVQIERISELVQEFNVALIGVDWGFGFGLNDRLIRRFGRQRVHKFHYMARVKKKVEYDQGIARFKVHRTEVMSDIFSAIKRKQFVFPRWEEFKTPFADDMLNIYSEYNDTLRMLQYDHNPDRPDDSFHALVYCFLVSMLKVPRPDIITPHREDPTRGPLLTSYKGPVDQG
jgi:hypothetical protein